jgi:antitoxin CptB
MSHHSAIADPTPAADAPQLLARLRWRCRRGMRELDVVLGRYLDQHYPHASPTERRAFEALLDEQDPQLFAYVMGRESPSDTDQINVIARLSHTAA